MKQKDYDELEFTDDFLFCRILSSNEDLCIELAEMITGRKIKSLLRVEEQKPISMTHDGKGVRFDVFFEDEENVIYDIEMQTVPKSNLPKRTRYYQGMIDLDNLGSGKDYNDLKENYIIFICKFAAFEKGRHLYSFENICMEDKEIRLKDGAHKIFLCAEGMVDDCSEKMRDFLNYIAKRETKGELSRRLQREVELSRRHVKWRSDYMTLLEHYKEQHDEGYAEGFADGEAKGEAERKALLEKGEAERKVLEAEIQRLREKIGELESAGSPCL
ncbi:MAG: Rpn family recombination-promoting nuclease/putative transposase [Lachnospiraceae bacterium]|nr:Rpn family recombination-promoting nuclease/putative transposase [Lachnospiraceae bacterium]